MNTFAEHMHFTYVLYYVRIWTMHAHNLGGKIYIITLCTYDNKICGYGPLN